jgi:hypothetical protein
MKILNKTKKYIHVRLSKEELELLQIAIRDAEINKQEEQEQLSYAEWFYTNHIDINWQDEYSSWHTDWKNIHTKETVSQSQVPGLLSGSIYKHRFRDIINKNKKKLGYPA